MRTLFVSIILLTMSTMAQAGLILHISPDGISGTRWQFEGSTTALSSDTSINSFWGENSGSLVNTFAGSYGITSGSGTMFSTSSGTHSVIDVWASTHSYAGLSPRVAYGAPPLSFVSGDVLSWLGDLTSDLPFASLNLGTVVADNIYGGKAISDFISITVSSAALGQGEVPAPAPLALLVLGLAAIGFTRRKSS